MSFFWYYWYIIIYYIIYCYKGSVWNWPASCQAAFENAKVQLSSSTVLTHFDPQMPVMLACDASACGLGAVISHKMPDSSGRPIAYASRTLSKTMSNYPQIEKEALGIIFGVLKFRDYLYGREFKLVTDRKSLVKILGAKTGIPAFADIAFRVGHNCCQPISMT